MGFYGLYVMSQAQHTTDATLTEHHTATTNPHASEPATITSYKNSTSGVWQEDEYNALDESPEGYKVVDDANNEYGTWQKAVDAVEN